MTRTTAQLNELIEITRDGQRFCEPAQDERKDVRLQARFRAMAQIKGGCARAPRGGAAHPARLPGASGRVQTVDAVSRPAEQGCSTPGRRAKRPNERAGCQQGCSSLFLFH